MKRFILLFTALPILCISQQTYVPDDNFEAYLETHDFNGNTVPIGDPLSMGNSIIDNYVTTANISGVIDLDVSYESISDLTGIEDFTALETLDCIHNQLTSLDVSNNINSAWLRCAFNQITSLDVSNNPALIKLLCQGNQLTSLDVSNNPALNELVCLTNQLTSLDVSNNPALAVFTCYDNQLTCLKVKNGTNMQNMISFHATLNPNLSCIEVDDSTYSVTNWVGLYYSFDSTTSFSSNCNYPASCWATSIQENTTNTSLFPNPTNDLITLDINGYNGSVHTQVYDLSGRLLETTNSTTISLKDYAKGIYVFRVAYGDIVEELKVVKE